MKTGPKFKIARRLGERIFPKTQTAKFTLSGTEKKKRSKRGKNTVSEYGQQLLEKQKAKYTYGLSEKQFSNYVKKAKSVKTDSTDAMFKVLETRLDNVIFRLGLTVSRAFARQVVSHGHILVNGRKVTIPSYQVKVGDKIEIRPQSKDNGAFRSMAERLKSYTAPNWLVYDELKNEGAIKALPVLGTGESNLNFASIFEFYSRV